MAILVRTCCCGCSLKTGILIIAVLGVLNGGYGIYSHLSKLKNLEDEMRELGKEGTLPMPYKDYNVVISLGYTNVVLNGLVIFTCILLMISSGKLKNKKVKSYTECTQMTNVSVVTEQAKCTNHSERNIVPSPRSSLMFQYKLLKKSR